MNIVEMAIIWLIQLIIRELQIHLERLWHPDGPHAVDGRVVGQAVVDPVHADVGGADEVLEAARLERAFSDVGEMVERVFDELVDGLEKY